MDVLAFLRDRMRFIREFYETAGEPFRETMRKIEAGEPPFEPPCSEDGEPPYLSEWIEADTALDVLGRACVSMVSASLKLYFETWEGQLGVVWEKGERKKAFKDGFLHGYKKCFAEVLSLSWDDCPADLEILEQVTLARNRDQHPDSITRMGVNHTPADREKYPRLFFASKAERGMYDDPDMAGISWMNPSVRVSAESLLQAIEEVEKLAGWLEPKMRAVRYGR
jgi:hypothetical protein